VVRSIKAHLIDEPPTSTPIAKFDEVMMPRFEIVPQTIVSTLL
jgi:hypothetical protein